MRYLLIFIMSGILSCSGNNQKTDTSLAECREEVKSLQGAVEILETTNNSLKISIKAKEMEQELHVGQLCEEGRSKVERLWMRSTNTVSAKDWSVLSCLPGIQVKMGVIDVKRKITSVQIKEDDVFKATRPFGWDSEMDRWHVLQPDLLLEVVGCGTSTCEVTCHLLTDIYQELPSCL